MTYAATSINLASTVPRLALKNVTNTIFASDHQFEYGAKKSLSRHTFTLQSSQQLTKTACIIRQRKRPISSDIYKQTPKKSKVVEPPVQEWDDLDANDWNDPLMVNEHVSDIFEYLHKLEIQSLPIKEAIVINVNIESNRNTLVDWIIAVHNKFDLLAETLYLAVNLIDRSLGKEIIPVDKMQLLGITCLFIASKYEEIYVPSVKYYAIETNGICTIDDIKQCEKYVLQCLGFSLNYPSPMNFLRRISKADNYDIKTRTLAKFLLEISLVDFRFVGVLPSLCAAAAMFLARTMLGNSEWSANLTHYSGGYTKDDMRPICEMLMDYLVRPVIHESFLEKYSLRRFMKASIISVQWALKIRNYKCDIMMLHCRQ